MKTSIRDFAHGNVSTAPPLELDALIVGAGFSGIYSLHEIRKLGLEAAIFEAGPDIGGNWRWNCYPGAGVDSEYLEYQFSIPETWENWNWSSNYPKYDELRAYFEHVSDVLDIRKDCVFGAFVDSAVFDESSRRWSVTTQDGRRATANYLIVGSGFAAKRYIPQWPGLNLFKGVIHHSSFWPEGGVDLRGKRCAIIGTGASGVQLTQALGPVAGSLTVFQRTPNLALPMHRRSMTVEEQERLKPVYPELFRLREKGFGGFHYTFSEKTLPEDPPEEQEAFFETLYKQGGFRFWLANYKDEFFDPLSNRAIYNFWARKVRPRIHDEKLRDLLAPLDPPHAFGVKRPSLEVDYFEQFNRPNVYLVDIRDNAISHITETGIILADGTSHDFDVICIATGFDVSSGGLMDMGLRSVHGTTLKEEWKDSVASYLGMTISGYPNLFFSYGPHAPTA
ncbi:flavin-containing monooxygenase [Aspergillus undulatus]|uniref:flavin-containing monooxygenase n=1 Tax=Aspergillus undulatus TaxID=1810928 RepID=UPI003CCDB3B6